MDQYTNQNEKKRSPKGLIIALVAVLAVLIGVSTFFLLHELKNVMNQRSTEEIADESKPLAEFDDPAPAESETEAPSKSALTISTEIGTTELQHGVVLMDVSEVVKNVMPSVVSIVDTLEYTQSFNPYSYFFGGGSSEPEEAEASGTGVIIGSSETELLIVTNEHVVNNEGTSSMYSVSSKGLTITFSDGSTAEATVKGTDSQNDLAVVAVKLSDIPSETKDVIKIAVVGSSDDAAIGSGVIVIGNAGGYGQSVTVGVLSAKEREVTIDGITRKLLQTDAAINPGNSGGGMFNSKGELIGINCAKTVSTDIEGMGFAIPVTSVQTIIESLMNTEVIPEEEQGYLGIRGETIPQNYIRVYGYPAGVSISYMMENSPAEAAGLQLYDIISEINGRSVASMEDLKMVVNGYRAGTTVKVKAYRPSGGNHFKEMEFEVTLVAYGTLE